MILLIVAASSLTDSCKAIAIPFKKEHLDVQINLKFPPSGLLKKINRVLLAIANL